jgi:hypothetical protein
MKQFITILTLLLALQLPSMAQEEELGTEDGPAPGDVPVDGGLTFLLAAGAAYGGRRLTQKGARKAD